MSRRSATATVLALILAAGACSTGEDDPEPQATTASPTPTASPIEEAVAPLLERDEVDVADLALPDAPDGVAPATWEASARMARDLAVRSLEDDTWAEKPTPATANRVARDLPASMQSSFATSQILRYAAGPFHFAPSFAEDAQPGDVKVVDARWRSAKVDQGGITLRQAVIQYTALYSLGEESAPFLVQRSFSVGIQQAPPTLGAFQWRVSADTAGQDKCTFYRDGVVTPSDDPDLKAVKKIVASVEAGKGDGTGKGELDDVKQSTGTTDFDALEKKACSGTGT